MTNTSSVGPRVLSRLVLLLLAVMMVLTPSRASAQAVYGSISGIVTDPTGAVVPGATVTITSVERKTSDDVVTNESGIYLKDRLLPGTYEVKAELQGFKSAVFPSIRVNVDTQTPLNIKFETGAVSESVTVAGFSPVLKTDRADVATTFDSKEISDLPVLDRNFTKFILLTPGTQQLGWQHAASENPQGSTQTMVNGQNFSGTSYQLDGTDNRDPILGIIVINPNFEAIGESKITSQNYDAEFGQATAGVVSVQTKSGSNSIHGSGFEFFQNDALQARNPFTQATRNATTGRFLPETKRNQFGGSLGGPIQKDRIFIFGDYQGTRSKVGGSQLLTVPTQAARNGDLSAYGVNIYDPTSGATPAQRTQFQNNVIPASMLSPQAQNLLKLIPLPNQPGTENGTFNNFVASGSEIFDNDTFDLRVDGRISDRLNAFGRYSFGDFRRNGPTAFGQGGGAALVTLGGDSKVRNQSLAAGFDRTIGTNMTADFRVGYFKYKVAVLPFDYGTTPALDAGIQGLNLDDNFTSGLPYGFIQGHQETRFGSGLDVNHCNCPLDQDEKQLQLVGNVTRMFQGNHTVKFGVDIRHAWNLRVPSDSHRSGQLEFNVDRTRGPNGGGLGLATFLLGDVTHLGRYVSPFTDAGERQWRQFYYAQDTWRASSKLTLNYGLRLDVINPQTVSGDGKGGFLLMSVTDGQIDIPSPNIAGCRCRRDSAERWREELAELGTALRGELSAEREDRHPRRLRPQLRHRCVRIALRPLRHAEPACPVRAGPQRREQLQLRLQSVAAGARSGVPDTGRQRSAAGAAWRLHSCLARQAAAADGRCLQRHRSARSRSADVGRGRLRRQSWGPCVRRRRTGAERKSADARRVRNALAGSAQTVLRSVRLDSGHRRVLQLRDEPLRLPADEVHQTLLEGLLGVRAVHLSARAAARWRPVLLQPGSRIRSGRLGSRAQLLDFDRVRAAVLAR